VPAKKVAKRRTKKKVARTRRTARRTTTATRRHKSLALLQQLDRAGVKLIATKGDLPDPTSRPNVGTKLTAASLRNLRASSGADFTAWGAWTLNF
jgi:hypothetical protein